jgi:hypothetical protein
MLLSCTFGSLCWISSDPIGCRRWVERLEDRFPAPQVEAKLTSELPGVPIAPSIPRQEYSMQELFPRAND